MYDNLIVQVLLIKNHFMYTILENARIVIALLKEHNIRHIVISPGGSNIPIVQGVQNDPFFKCYSIVDERSAMYFAIGLYLKYGEPIATSCTSAQATRNYVPGLTEAFYKHVPILAITMSKHPRYLGQEYMQCSILTSLPVDTVKKSYSLPYISNDNDRAQCVRTANEAILEMTHHSKGPVQLNIEELDSETWVFGDLKELPPVRAIKRISLRDHWNFPLKGKKIMLVIGEHRPFPDHEIDAIEHFCEVNNVFVYVDHTSNYFGKYARICSLTVNNMSNSLFETEFLPDILITIGGLTGNYGIYGKLFNAPDGSFEHWRVSEDGNVIDTYGKLTKIFECCKEDFFTKMSTNSDSDHEYFNAWSNLIHAEQRDVSVPFSNIYAAQKLNHLIPENSYLNFAIHNSLRSWSYFPLSKSIKCFSNIAAFGIDGCLSTFLGQSIVTDELSFLIIGDLAFFYDMNALGIRHLKNNIRILLVNNNGGAEFKLGDLESQTDVGSYISADGHYTNAKGWAETCNFKYMHAPNKEEFDRQISEFVDVSEQSIVFEIFTRSEDEKKAMQIFNQNNWHGTKHEEIKKGIKSDMKNILGDKGAAILGKIVNRKF